MTVSITDPMNLVTVACHFMHNTRALQLDAEIERFKVKNEQIDPPFGAKGFCEPRSIAAHRRPSLIAGTTDAHYPYHPVFDSFRPFPRKITMEPF